tara:strand:- start:7862 stop:8749 length:888 start_codon:yes stop_codon:yes gene_type:complete
MAKKKSHIPDIIDNKANKPGHLPVPTDALGLYLAQINRYDLLSPEEEHDLAIKYYEERDPLAAERLVTSNLRFVVSVAAEYSKFGAKMIDLVQEGNVGLMHAVREFNPYKGVRLITYAVWWIRGYIREYLLKQFSMVKLSTSSEQKKLFYQLQKEKALLEAKGEEFDVDAFSEKIGIDASKVEAMEMRLSQRDVSLDTPIDEGGKTLLLDMQENQTAVDAEEELAHLEEVEVLKEKIDAIKESLNEKEVYILENRVLHDSPMTLQEIGDHFGITRERSRQIEANIIKKLKQAYQD